jgi:hypothetical protein
MSTEKLFDTSLYSQASPEVVAEDLAGLFIEAGTAPLEHRINARKLKIEGNKVIDPKTGKEVPGSLKRSTILDNLEADSAEQFYTQLLKGFPLVLSLSASGGLSPYKDARINVGYRISDDEIEFYGIPTLMNPETLLGRSLLLSEFSNMSIFEIKNADQLRGVAIPIKIPPSEISPWDFLEEVFPLDSNAWQQIKQGRPWLFKDNALKDARSFAPKMVGMIRVARTERDFIFAGAYGERQMEERGWKLNYGSCPGKSNSELVGESVPGKSFVTDAFGNIRETTTKWEYHTGTCVNCGASGVAVGPCNICKTCEAKL